MRNAKLGQQSIEREAARLSTLISGIGGGAAHNVLSATHSDASAAAVVRGDIITGQTGPVWAKLALGASGTVLRSDGTDLAYVDPASYLPVAPGAQNQMIIANATPAWSLLAAPSAQNQVLLTGASPFTPSWSALFDATVPNVIQCDDAAATGSANVAARRDHEHGIVCAAPTTNLTATSSNAEGSASTFARSDHSHDITTTTGAVASSILATNANSGIRPDRLAVGTAIPDQDGVIALPETTDPTNAANEGRLYTKDDGGGNTELYYMDEGGTVHKLTPPGAAPTDAQYVCMTTDATLTDERVLTAGDGLDLTDGGAGGNATLAVDVTDLLGSGLTEAANNIALNWGTPTISTIQCDDAANTGTSTNPTRSDHKHAIVCAAPSANLTVATTNAEGSATSFARSDHSHAITSSSNPGAAASILASDASGYLQLVRLGIAKSPIAPINIGAAVTTNPSLLIQNTSYSSSDASGTCQIEMGWSNHYACMIEASKRATNVTDLKLYAEYGFNTSVLGLTLYPTSIGCSVGIGTSAPDRHFHAEVSDAVINTVTYAQRLSHITSGTAAAGFGTGIEFELEDAGGGMGVLAAIQAIETDATAGAEHGAIAFLTADIGNDGLAERVRINHLGNVGIGASPGNYRHLVVQNTAWDSGSPGSVASAGIYNVHAKTAGSTTQADDFYGIYSWIDMDDSGSTIGELIGIWGYARLVAGTIGDGQENLIGGLLEAGMDGGTAGDNVYGAHLLADIDAGTVTGDVIGAGIRADIEPGVTSIGGDVYGLKIEVDADTDPSGTVYMLQLLEGTNVDYGIYQSGSAPHYFNGISHFNAGFRTIVSTDNVSSPPTDAQLDSAFGTPATVGEGFIGLIDDNNAETDVWLCVAIGSSWFYEQLTKAV